ncbi:MAG: hypothetical protein K2W81_12580 [Sphingomonas sp.]|uniref:hypothetical protein n=1 Tax=Sphingomonas sp. TaxID=28214 RepID=UPI0025CF1156|nr:hypothetical protein [Sphingomonas sp.]MBY0284783.1 hypothetical protein [Sphingomonas sp.]
MSDTDDGKTVRLNVGIWFNDRTGQIHIAAKGQFISTVSADPKSKRYHPNLYRKLAATLRDADKPHPNRSPEGEGPEE